MDTKNPECCRRSFAASIKDTAKRLLEDPTIAPRHVVEQRMEMCRACTRFEARSQTCVMCGCFMPMKTTMANMRCPVDLWEEWKRDS